MKRALIISIFLSAFTGASVWALLHFTAPRAQPAKQSALPDPRPADPDLWTRGFEKARENRPDSENVGLEIPSELRHYEDRHWFLATQVAEVKKFKFKPIQDFVDLAARIKRGDLVPVPAATDTYILFGVGARVDGAPFTRYVAHQNIELNDEAGLDHAYAGIESAHAELQKEISDLQEQIETLKKKPNANSDELQQELAARQQELRSNEEEKARIEQYYGKSSNNGNSQQRLLRDYDSLQFLANSFRGRSFKLDASSDRQALKIYMLSSLRPQALKLLEEIAQSYHDKFDRPLPISSLVRPEQYQRALRKVNRYAVLIDTPPHSTGLAFDIDYRYLSGAEQNFLMGELARMKDEGRIEVLRERGANYHVFVFMDGRRPSDELITASLPDAGAPDNSTTPANKSDREDLATKQKQPRAESRSHSNRKRH